MSEHDGYRLSVRFGQEILARGHTAIPNLVLSYYTKLGISGPELLFTIHVWQHWWSDRDPYPSLRTIATRMGISVRQAKRYVESLEHKGFLRVVERFLPNGSQTTNEFDYSPLIRAVVDAARSDGALQPGSPSSQVVRRTRTRLDPRDTDVTGEEDTNVTLVVDSNVTPPVDIHGTGSLTVVSPKQDQKHADVLNPDEKKNSPQLSWQRELDTLITDVVDVVGSKPSTQERQGLVKLAQELIGPRGGGSRPVGREGALELVAVAMAELAERGVSPYDCSALRKVLGKLQQDDGVDQSAPAGAPTRGFPRSGKEERKEGNLRLVWEGVLGELQGQMTVSNFSRWLARSRLVHCDAGIAEVTVPDVISADQLAVHFDPLIRRTLAERWGTAVTVRYRADSGLAEH
ncbi:MAG: helix-turn-helix domain-containing protein [Chloroflexi bacterium]|nr:helix-turn-helix domain-containing protein [Chloroflexota bacterium]